MPVNRMSNVLSKKRIGRGSETNGKSMYQFLGDKIRSHKEIARDMIHDEASSGGKAPYQRMVAFWLAILFSEKISLRKFCESPAKVLRSARYSMSIASTRWIRATDRGLPKRVR